MPIQKRATVTLFDVAGHPLHLGSELGSGGEGGVYEVRDRSDVVVKLYRKPLHPEQSAKIAAMATFASERLRKLTAWPIEPLVSETGSVVGFTMTKITGHKLAFKLSSPKLRLQEFPTASWQFLIHSAANTARAFSVVHELGHVIGDVKQENLFIGDRATVRLIDCDSYQVAINGARWFCEVGTSTHQPPELQNVRSYKGILRTSNHDNFGLAVIIFQILFMGRHPFSGRFLGTGEMPMERAISECRFAYSSNAAAIQMEPALASVGLKGVTGDVAHLFERAFSKQGSQANGRPRADEWVRALEDLEQHLRKCPVNPAHQFVDRLSKCPWCDIEIATRVPLFQVGVVGSVQTGFSIAAFWAKVNSVPNPGPPPALPPLHGLTVALSPAMAELQRAGFDAQSLPTVVIIIRRLPSLKKELETKISNARARWQNLENGWDKYTRDESRHNILLSLQNLRREYENLGQRRSHALQKLEANRRQLQLHAYLDGCRISRARIPGVGDTKKATLQSYGIETAADIVDHRILAVPGFGPGLLDNLKRWRDQQEKRFVFDPNKGVDQGARNAIEQRILTEKIELERKLNEGLSQLTVSSHHILTRRRSLIAQAEQTAHDLAQAEADLRALEQAARDLTRAEANRQAAEQAARHRALAAAKPEAVAPVPSTLLATKSTSVVSRKTVNRTILAVGALLIGGVIVASYLGKERPPAAPEHLPQQTQPQQIPPRTAPPAPPFQQTTPPHLEKDASGQLRPEDGYVWSDGNHTGVRWARGKLSRKYPHVVASDTPGEWQPDDGYNWVDLTNPKDKSVRWVQRIASDRNPDVVAAPIEGRWLPADGYTWVVDPPRPGDLRVKPMPRPGDQSSTPTSDDPFERGIADRTEWERWVAALSGDFRGGAEWWAGHRSLPTPGSCSELVGRSQDFLLGCAAAEGRLTPADIKRTSDPEYRRGWNSFTGSIIPPSAPDIGVPPAQQSTMDTPPGNSETGAADRLNAQELQGLRAQ